MKIIGIGGSIHDTATCLLENDHFTAIEEERLTRVKYNYPTKNYKLEGLAYCLENKSIDDVDLIVSHDILPTEYVSHNPLHRCLFINHHLAHACSTFFTSKFNESAVLILDGEGSIYKHTHEWCTLYYAHDNKFEILDKYYGETSLAKIYEYFTYLCGFGFGQEGKLMGLFPYGTDRFVPILSKYIKMINKKLHFNPSSAMLHELYAFIYREQEQSVFAFMADIAYAVQIIFESMTFEIMNKLFEKTKCRNICCAGGAFMNSVLNGKIKQKTPFKNIHIFPAPGDSGVSIGCTLYAKHIIGHESEKSKLQSFFLGKEYSDTQIFKSLNKYSSKIIFKEYDNDNLIGIVSNALREMKIIGWYQGGSEFGARALGNRSILADARNAEMKEILNCKVKFREKFRPFAPVCLFEEADNYFHTQDYDNKYMQYVVQAKNSAMETVPAALHIDKSARLQTITAQNNPKLYKLLLAYQKLTSIPILLNTSFNIKGQPIVETVDDAMIAYLNSEIDLLVIGNILIEKR